MNPPSVRGTNAKRKLRRQVLASPKLWSNADDGLARFFNRHVLHFVRTLDHDSLYYLKQHLDDDTTLLPRDCEDRIDSLPQADNITWNREAQLLYWLMRMRTWLRIEKEVTKLLQCWRKVSWYERRSQEPGQMGYARRKLNHAFFHHMNRRYQRRRLGVRI